MTKQNIALEVKNVSKSFRLPTEQASGIKQAFLNWTKGIKGYKEQHVLKDISFKVEKGDFFGIVGRNGSGKSTLLKIISQIYTPEKGEVKVNGTLVPFIELGVGFNPELTGRENVYMNGALLGFSREEISKMYPDIVEFAELEEFMDQKLKNYSSGMQVRLAFSIAIKAESDILVLDEVLAVGDEAFQRKCEDYFKQLKKQKQTVILVTHSMDSVRKYCNKAMLIKDGKIAEIGNPDKIADEYSGLNLLSKGNKNSNSHNKNKPEISAKIISKRVLSHEDTLKVEITYKARNTQPVFAKAYIEFNGQAIMATNPRLLGWGEKMITRDTKTHIAHYSLPLDIFNTGEYKVVALLEDVKTKANLVDYGYENEMLIKITNKSKSSSGGLLINQAKIELKK